MDKQILMPINEKFIEVFEIFMNDEQKLKIRANNVRQYVEGIVDLLLKDKILPQLKSSETYKDVNWKRKINIIREYYDKDISENIQNIFKIGGEGSHFNGKVSENELLEIIEQASHIVEDIFVKYFLNSQHRFGTENIFTIFSMLPLQNRIYILENIYKQDKNQSVVDRLSLAYLKIGKEQEAIELLESAFQDKVIDNIFKSIQLEKLSILRDNLSSLYEKNANYENNPEYSTAIFKGKKLIVGLPTSKNIFETAKAVNIFKQWFEEAKDKYPEFINLFLFLMARDEREYV